jgi:hypothetical protein
MAWFMLILRSDAIEVLQQDCAFGSGEGLA